MISELPLKNLQDTISLDDIEPSARAKLIPVSSGAIDVYEGFLRYAIARVLQPENRLLSDAVNQAAKLSNLTGLRSSKLIQQRLQTISQLLV